MTTTKTKMIQATLAILAATVLSHSAAAETSLTVARNRTVAKCTGAYDVKVIDWSGYGPALYIYEHGRLVTSQWVEESSDESGGVEMTYYKTDASIFNGGASLRIRSESDQTPRTEGTAWLTFNRRNSMLDCSIF